MTKTGFSELHDLILQRCVTALEHDAPTEVEAFRESVKNYRNVDSAVSFLASIDQAPELDRFRQLCVNMVDVKLQMHRVRISLILMQGTTVPTINQGEWVEYHFNAWALLLQGLLSRTEKFARHFVRKVLRGTREDWKSVTDDTVKPIADLKSRLKVLRDPIAHSGGSVEATSETHVLGAYVLLGGYDASSIFAAHSSSQQRWLGFMKPFTDVVFSEIDDVCSYLQSSLPGGILR